MSLESLKRIAPPPPLPADVGTPGEWVAVERRLGTPLPDDYKSYIDSYGTGGFNDFILPYSPFAVNQHLNLLKALADHHEAARVKALNFPDDAGTTVAPFELYPSAGGLLPCGTTSNFGDYFFWQVEGAPERWPVVLYNLRDGDYEVFQMNFTGLLAGLLVGGVRTDLLPQEFLGADRPVRFRPSKTA